MNPLRKAFLGLSLTCFISSANAGITSDLSSLFMSNTTPAGQMNTADRSGVFGGSFVARAPLKQINLIAFDPPRYNAGCGGVDLSMGSFSFVSSAQIVATFRAVAANASGLAFKAAIKLVSPSLDALITEFQTLLQTMNNLAKNSCAMAKMIVDKGTKAIGDAVDGDGSIAATTKGIFGDQNSGLVGYLASANSYLNNTGKNNPTQGNQLLKALVASGTTNVLGLIGFPNPDSSTDDASDPNSINNRVIVSMLGYQIDGIPCSGAAQDGTAVSTTSDAKTTGRIQCNGPHTISLESFVLGGGAGSYNPDHPLQLYKCLNPSGSGDSSATDQQICTQMQITDFTYQGIRGWINSMLFGSYDDTNFTNSSILGQMNSTTSAKFSPAQKQFISGAGQNIVGLLQKTSDTTARMMIARELRTPIEDCISAAVGRALYKAAVGVTYNNSYVLSDESKEQTKQLRKDYLRKDELCTNNTSTLKIIQSLNGRTTLNNSGNK